MDQKAVELSVIKSNEIIQARYNLTVREQKFLLYLVSIIDRKQEEQKTIEVFDKYEIKITEVEKILNMSGKKWGSIYKIVEDIVTSLQRNPLRIILPNGNLKIMYWTDSLEFVAGKGIIIYQFSNSIFPYVLKLREHFTKYNLSNILYLQSSYSIRIYELLKSNEYRHQIEYELLELKKMFFGEEYLKKYPVYYDFKKRVLLKAQEELKERSDISFTFKEKRKARKIHSITFFIHKNEAIKLENSTNKEADMTPDNDPLNERKSPEIDGNIKAILVVLTRNGIVETQAIKIAENGFLVIKNKESRRGAEQKHETFLDYVKEKVLLLRFEVQEKKIKNPQGFLIKALEENYVNPAHLNNVKKKEQREKAKAKKALQMAKKEEIKVLKNTAHSLDVHTLKGLLNDIEPSDFFSKIETGSVGILFSAKLDRSKSPLENYTNQSYPGKVSILNTMISNYKNDFETAEKIALDQQIKAAEFALRKL